MTMQHTITNAAVITVLEPIDNNYTTGGGDLTIGGCLVIASKGKPFETHSIYGNTTTRSSTFGDVLPKKSYGMEGLRHLEDAIVECSYVKAIRVVDTLNYRFPSISFSIINDLNAEYSADTLYSVGDIVTVSDVQWICVYEDDGVTDSPAEGCEDWILFNEDEISYTETHRYNETVTVGDGVLMTIYPVDGDTSVNRTVHITDIDSDNKRFTITIYDKDANGDSYELASHEVGIDEDDTDDMGLSAYIETVFERDSDYFRVDFAEGKKQSSL